MQRVVDICSKTIAKLQSPKNDGSDFSSSVHTLYHNVESPEYDVFIGLIGLIYHAEEAANKLFTRKLIKDTAACYSRSFTKTKNNIRRNCATIGAIAIMSVGHCDLENPSLAKDSLLKLICMLQEEIQNTYGKKEGIQRF